MPSRQDVIRYKDELLNLGVLEEKRSWISGVYLLTSSPWKEDAEVICGLDPFCYLSHQSAMEYHGLTDRLPKVLFITTLPPSEWKDAAFNRMRKDLGDDFHRYLDQANLPPMKRHSHKPLSKKAINVTTNQHLTPSLYVSPKDRPVRVSALGRTFLDMLRRPDLCGGMNHVIDVFSEHASTYLKLITSEIDRHGTSVDKVRAGFILENYCGIENNDHIQSWVSHAQRGGSRRLDPGEAYWPEFSEKWCLSINVSR